MVENTVVMHDSMVSDTATSLHLVHSLQKVSDTFQLIVPESY